MLSTTYAAYVASPFSFRFFFDQSVDNAHVKRLLCRTRVLLCWHHIVRCCHLALSWSTSSARNTPPIRTLLVGLGLWSCPRSLLDLRPTICDTTWRSEVKIEQRETTVSHTRRKFMGLLTTWEQSFHVLRELLEDYISLWALAHHQIFCSLCLWS